MVGVAGLGDLRRRGMNTSYSHGELRLRSDRRRKRGENLLGDFRGDVRLNLQHIGELARERLGPQVRLIADLDELNVDAQLFAGALYVAFQHVFHVEDATNFRDGLSGNNLGGSRGNYAKA